MTRPAPSDERPRPDDPATGTGPRRLPPQHVVKRTRMGAMWFAAASSAVVLVLLLIFILENSREVQISYFGAHGQLPLGVALLFAAVLGILLAAVPGTARIIQLRILARRHRGIDAGIGDGRAESTEAGASAPGSPDDG